MAALPKCMEKIKGTDWKQGWICGANGFAGQPQNVGGHHYSSSNLFRVIALYSETCLQAETMQADTFVVYFQYILPIKLISASANGSGASMAVKCPP